MASIPAKIKTRISEGIKKFQPILENAKVRDINESDTVILLNGIISEVLGFDRYTDITTELAIRGTYCDIAIKMNDKIHLLIEAKAIGVDLKEQHIKQAVDYAANKGIEWVILTNSINWKVYKIIFSKPIQNILVMDLNLLQINPKLEETFENLFFLCKEAVSKYSLDDFYTQKQAVNRYLIGNLLFEEKVLAAIRKELKEVYPDIKVSVEEIQNVIKNEILKREIFDSEDAVDAKKKISKANKKKEKAKENIKAIEVDSKSENSISESSENQPVQ